MCCCTTAMVIMIVRFMWMIWVMGLGVSCFILGMVELVGLTFEDDGNF